MSNGPRKTTPARKPRQQRSPKEEANVMVLTTGGVEHFLDINELSALDERRLEIASRPRNPDGSPTGERGIQITAEMEANGFSLSLIAGLVWLRVSQGDPSVTFDQVAAKLKLTDLESVEMITHSELAKRQGVDPTDPSH